MIECELPHDVVAQEHRRPGVKEAIVLESMIQERTQTIPLDDLDQRDIAIQVLATLMRARNEIQTLTRKPPSLGKEIAKQPRREIRRPTFIGGPGSCGVKTPHEPKPRLDGHNA